MIFQTFLFATLIAVVYPCTTRNITVTGTVACGEHAQEFVVIELRESDTFMDDSLNKTSSDNNGNFKIYGEECEVGGIEPYLRITHKCDGGVINRYCTLTDDFPIPEEHIGGTYNMGIVSLNIARSNHKKECTQN